MKIFDRFQEVIDKRHEYARDWKARTGGKVFGNMCIYVPQEIIYAAGILPVRILGSHETQDVAESHIHQMFCPFCRDVLAQGLQGRYDYLDGMVMAQTCLHMHQAFNVWQIYKPVLYSYFLSMPSPVSHKCDEFFTAEIKSFKESLEKHLGSPVEPADLKRSMEVYHTNRSLLRKIYDLRKKEKPPISGTEAAQMMLAGLIMDKEEHNKLLVELYENIKGKNEGPEEEIRLMLLGSENDDIEFIKLVEEQGAKIVIDDICTGSRNFWNNTTLKGDPIADLAAAYVNMPPCSIKNIGARPGFKHTMDLAKEYRVQGVIYAIQKFCDTYQFDFPAMEALFKEQNIPILHLEFDVTLAVGQVKNRVEAFLEMLRVSAFELV